MKENGGEGEDVPEPVLYTLTVKWLTGSRKGKLHRRTPVKEVLHLIQSHLYRLISKGFSNHQSHPGILLQHLPQSHKQTMMKSTPPLHQHHHYKQCLQEGGDILATCVLFRSLPTAGDQRYLQSTGPAPEPGQNV